MESKYKKHRPVYEFPERTEISDDMIERDGFDIPPRALNVIASYSNIGKYTDPLGMWTGTPTSKYEKPIQDADDL